MNQSLDSNEVINVRYASPPFPHTRLIHGL